MPFAFPSESVFAFAGIRNSAKDGYKIPERRVNATKLALQ